MFWSEFLIPFQDPIFSPGFPMDVSIPKKGTRNLGFVQNACLEKKKIPSYGLMLIYHQYKAKNHQRKKSKEVLENSEIVKTFYLGMPTVADRRFCLGSPEPKRCRLPETNIFTTENLASQEETRKYSNHPFSGAKILVLGSVISPPGGDWQPGRGGFLHPKEVDLHQDCKKTQ